MHPDPFAQRNARSDRVHQGRPFLAGLLGGTTVLAVLWSLGAGRPADPVSRVVEAEKFILRDPEGRPRAELRMGKGGPELAFLAEDQRARLVLGIRPLGSAGFEATDEAGHLRALLNVSE